MYLKMSVLTRNFYDKKSVEDALVAAVTTKHPLRKNMITFWTHELFVSEEWAALIEALTTAWMYCPPFQGAAAKWKSLCSSDSSLELLGQFLPFLQFPFALLSEIQKPYPEPNADGQYDVEIVAKDVIPKKPTSWTEFQRRVLLRNVRISMEKKRTRRLYCLLAGLPPTTALEYLDTSSVNKQLLEAYKKTRHGLQHILVELGMKWDLPPLVPSPVNWSKQEAGRLSARLFSIPPKFRKLPIELSGFDVLHGCQFWQRELSAAGILREESVQQKRLVFTSDEALEEFYGRFFPDDIPDEWSAEERAKTHIP